MDKDVRQILYEGALEAARKKGVPEEKLNQTKGIADVYDLMREHDEEERKAALDEHRKKLGLPSLRNRDAHKE